MIRISAVRIGNHEELARGATNAGFERRAITLISFVVDHSKLSISLLHFAQALRRCVRRAVIDDDQFVRAGREQ